MLIRNKKEGDLVDQYLVATRLSYRILSASIDADSFMVTILIIKG